MECSRKAARHGRGVRGPLFPPEVPRWRSRSGTFDSLVLDTYTPIYQAWSEELSSLDVAVDSVPRMRSTELTTIWPDDVVADGPVPLGRLIAAGVDARGVPTRPRIVVFRQPIELRTKDLVEREQLLRQVIGRLVAVYLNVEPWVIVPELRGRF